MSVLGVQVNDLVNSGNYYDIVQLQDFKPFRQVVGHQGRHPDVRRQRRISIPATCTAMSACRWSGRSRTHLACASTTAVSPIELINVDEGAKYTDILPSLNLYYDLDRHNRIRFALAKVMARPRMDDMRANLVPGFMGGSARTAIRQSAGLAGPVSWSIPGPRSGGNPKLEPWRAKELDVGYEWYGGKASYFSRPRILHVARQLYLYAASRCRLHGPYAAANRAG